MDSTIVANTVGGPVLVSRPDQSSVGRVSVDILKTLLLARRRHGTAHFLGRPDPATDALLSLTTDDIPVGHAGGITGAWLRARWRVATVARLGADRFADASASFWHELYREIRRHAGDERLPSPLRSQLRATAQRSLARSAAAGRRAAPFPRRLLRDRVKTFLPASLLEEATRRAGALGIRAGAPVVAFEVRTRPEAAAEAIRFLVSEGYTVVRIGETSSGALHLPGVIELASSADSSPLLDLFVLLSSRFLVCGSIDLQHVAYLTNTPSLTLNASDPFSAYPIREDGLYTLRTVVDLDTGRLLTADDLLSDSYFRNLRNCGYRDNTPGEMLEAVREMHEGVTHGWSERESQAQFRKRVGDAGAVLARSVPLVAEWGPDEGFIGDGRLARFQAAEVR